MPDRHLSSQFDADLNSLSSRLLEMGGLVESQISTAMRAFTQMDIETCNIVIQNEKLVNDLEIQIDSACTELIARRQPTARDLRLVMAVSKAITNLERAGDEAERAVGGSAAATDGAAPIKLAGAPPAKVKAPVVEEEDEAPAPKAKAKAKPKAEVVEEDESEPEVRKAAPAASVVPVKSSKLASIVSAWDDED
jgi:phosphate transport system protein